MKNYTEYWKQTCIDFGKYVYNNRVSLLTDSKDIDELWIEFQEQQAKDINDVLDGIPPNDKLKSDAIPLDEYLSRRLRESVDELEFGSTQDKINHQTLMLIAENNAVNDERWKKNEEVLIDIAKLCKSLSGQIDNLNSLIKLTDTIVSANSIALNNIEKESQQDVDQDSVTKVVNNCDKISDIKAEDLVELGFDLGYGDEFIYYSYSNPFMHLTGEQIEYNTWKVNVFGNDGEVVKEYTDLDMLEVFILHIDGLKQYDKPKHETRTGGLGETGPRN